MGKQHIRSCAERTSCVMFILLAQVLPAAADTAADNDARTGDTASHSAATTLDTIVVKGEALEKESPSFSTTVVETEEFRTRRISQPQDMFRHVPGMAVRTLGLPGVGDSIVIRGFGNGGHGGDLGVVIDGIPLNEAMSHTDGYVDLNTIVPLEIDAMTVYRGPVSVMYGNYNRGGLITYSTRKGGHYTDFDASIAENSTVDAQFALGREIHDRHAINLAAQAYHSDGFRPQSEFDRYTLSGRWSLAISPDLQFGLAARLYNAEGDNPSYVPPTQWQTDPYSIHADVKNDGSHKDFASVRADLGYSLGEEMRLLGFAYTTRQDFTRWFTRPVSGVWTQREETYDRTVYGGGLSLNGRATWGERHLDWVAGIETFRESTDFMFFDDLDFRERIDPAILNREFRLDSASAFAQADWFLHRLFQPTFGVRVDRFSGHCAINGTETSGDPCQRMDAMTPVNPKVGVRSQIREWLQLRASWSRGFALPDESSKYALGSQDVDPNIFDQTELGLRIGSGQGLNIDLAVYRIDSSDEIGQPSPGEYINFGKTRRRGIEVDVKYLSSRFEVGFNAGTADSSIERSLDAAIVGNEVTGVPEYTATANVAWMPMPSLRLDGTWRRSGDYWIDAANTRREGGYSVGDVAVSWLSQGASPWRVYLAVENVTDKVYATAVSSLGYAAGAPRTFRVGFQFGF